MLARRTTAAVAELAPRQRAVLVRYFCDLPVAETARELRCSEGTVRSQATRALKSLRSLYPVDSGFLAESEL